MSEFAFKNLSEIDTVEAPADGTTMMGFQNGVPIQMPMSAVKSGGGVFIINPDDPEYSTTNTAYGNKVKEALLSGKNVWFYHMLPASTTTNERPYDSQTYTWVISFMVSEDTSGHFISLVFDAAPPLILRITVD